MNNIIQKHQFVNALYILLISFVMSCSSGSDNGAGTFVGEGTATEDFTGFYIKFHADSIFQIDRISFPVAGNLVKDDSEAGFTDLMHQKSNWKIHKRIKESADFEQQFEPLTEDLIFEKIAAKSGNYAIERRFARLSTGWHLIYYRSTTF